MRLTFVVKGKDSIATEAKLTQYGLTCRKINETKYEEVFETYPDNLEKLVHWFCEDSVITPGFGFPNGTLLIYSCHDDQECRLLERE